MYYSRDVGPLPKAQRYLKSWSIGDRGELTLLLFALVVLGPALTVYSYCEFSNADGIELWPEPKLGAWTWLLCLLVLLWPIAAVAHSRVRDRYYVWIYESYGCYFGNDSAEQFVDNHKLLQQLPPAEKQRRALWLDNVQAYEERDLVQLQRLEPLIKTLLKALDDLREAQRVSSRNRLVLQDTKNRIEQINLETEALQKELAS